MAHVIEKTVYAFAELNDRAKERARDWYRGCIESDELTDHDDWSTIAGILGIDFATHSVPLYGGGTRQEPRIYWSLYPSWCAFDGSYAYAKGAPKAIRAHAPQDTELHRIADELQQAQRTSFYRIECRTEETREFMQVRHVGDNPAARVSDEEKVTELLRDFANWIVRQVEAQNEYLMSAECVDESIEANAYQFGKYGNVA